VELRIVTDLHRRDKPQVEGAPGKKFPPRKKGKILKKSKNNKVGGVK